VKPANKTKNSLPKQKNYRAIVLNTFATYIQDNQEQVKRVYFDEQEKQVPEGFFEYNFRKLDRRGPWENNATPRRSQYKMTSVEKIREAFLLSSDD